LAVLFWTAALNAYQPNAERKTSAVEGLNELFGGYMPAPIAEPLALLSTAVGLFLLCALVHWVTRRWLLRMVSAMVARSRNQWDDALYHRKVFRRLSHFAPALALYVAVDPLFPAEMAAYLKTGAQIYLYLAGALFLSALFDGAGDIYSRLQLAKTHPIKGYLQAFKIIVFMVVAILTISAIMNKSPALLLSGLGAVTALLLLVFREPILGVVASIQLAANNMVRPGDWITVPKAGADGDVIDVSLTTVKVQNWDKTISTVPIYTLISDSFINWRGMSESGGRRIKRSINIDMSSIRFCNREMADRFEKIALLRDYIREKKEELSTERKERGIAEGDWINGRNLTNIGCFRMYVGFYLRQNKQVHQDMTLMVRQLQPGPEGLPIEIYAFSNDIRWAFYEQIQADIFDHLLAVLPAFELRVFQNPTGADFHRVFGAGRAGEDDSPPSS